MYHLRKETNYSVLILFDNKLCVSLKLVYVSAQKGWQVVIVTNHAHLMQLCVSVTPANSW